MLLSDLRIKHPLMEYYRDTYTHSTLWKGENLSDKVVIIYCEQGFGDIIQFFRFFPSIQKRAKKVYLHCPLELHRLFQLNGFEVLDKFEPDLPYHDFHILSMDIPFVINESECPYIHVDNNLDLGEGLKVGIAWEGSGHFPNKACPLKHFKSLEGKLFCLQKEIVRQDLIEDCEDMDLFSVHKNDFLDTAELINSVDYVVSVDTAVLHLAGAMGKKTYALLTDNYDCRWNHDFYDIVKLIGTWEENFMALAKHLRNEFE